MITRESTSYLSNYPILSSVIHRIYTIVFPVCLILVVFLKWKSEFSLFSSNFNGYFVFDTVICVLIQICTLLYLSWIHFSLSANTVEGYLLIQTRKNKILMKLIP